jgi:hypothetical protein
MVPRIEIEIGRRLEATAEPNQHIVGNVTLTVANLLRTRAIYIDGPLRQIERLLDAQIRSTRNLADLLHDVFRQRSILFYFLADQLNVNLRWKAKIQNLAHHVGGQIVELGTWKLLAKHFTQPLRITIGRMMILIERH